MSEFKYCSLSPFRAYAIIAKIGVRELLFFSFSNAEIPSSSFTTSMTYTPLFKVTLLIINSAVNTAL